MTKIVGVYVTYSDRELGEALIRSVARSDRRAYRAIFDEIETRKISPTFATSEAVERARANVREAVADYNAEAPDPSDLETYSGTTALTGDYAVQGISGRVYIGFAYVATVDEVPFSGFVYLSEDEVLNFVDHAEEIGLTLSAILRSR